MVFQGANIGDNCRIAAGAIVHLKTTLPKGTRIGLRHVAAPEGDGYLSTTDIEMALGAIVRADFFQTVFGEAPVGNTLHSNVTDRILKEVSSWSDSPA